MKILSMGENNIGLRKCLATALVAVTLSGCVEQRNQDVCACLERGDEIETIREERGCGVSFYSDYFIGRETAYGGEIFSQEKLTVAHKTLPYNTELRLTATFIDRDGQYITNSVDVRVNDKGPFIPGRSFDVTKKAFRMLTKGVTTVRKGEKYIDGRDLNLGVLNNVCAEILFMPPLKE